MLRLRVLAHAVPHHVGDKGGKRGVRPVPSLGLLARPRRRKGRLPLQRRLLRRRRLVIRHRRQVRAAGAVARGLASKRPACRRRRTAAAARRVCSRQRSTGAPIAACLTGAAARRGNGGVGAGRSGVWGEAARTAVGSGGSQVRAGCTDGKLRLHIPRSRAVQAAQGVRAAAVGTAIWRARRGGEKASTLAAGGGSKMAQAGRPAGRRVRSSGCAQEAPAGRALLP